MSTWTGPQINGPQDRARPDSSATFSAECSCEPMALERRTQPTPIPRLTLAPFTNSLPAALPWLVTGPRWAAATAASTRRALTRTQLWDRFNRPGWIVFMDTHVV